MPDHLSVTKYVDMSWLVKLSNEEVIEDVARLSFDAFRRSLYANYLPRFREANQIISKRQRLATQAKLGEEFTREIKRFYKKYQTETLASVEKTALQNARIKYGFLTDRKPRKQKGKLADVKDESEKRTIQLDKPRHRGKRDHVTDRLSAGLVRDAKRIGVPGGLTESQYRRRTAQWFQTVARTEAQAVIADADRQAVSEYSDKFLYVAIVDEVTTNICRQHDGKTYDAAKASSPRPPLHFNCRSEIQPVPDDPARAKALKRATEAKFGTWFKNQSPDTQREIIGDDKLFEAYKAGKYTPPPRWKSRARYNVDKETGLPIVATAKNRDRIVERVELVDVEFDENI